MSEELIANLNDKQRLFVSEYVKAWNATRAAKTAGYSEKTAYSQGNELLKKPEIRAYIKEFVTEALSANKETLQIEIVEKLREIAFGVKEDGRPYTTRHQLSALEKLGKYMSMFTEVHDVKHSGEVTHRIASMSDEELDEEITRIEQIGKD